MLSFLPGIAFTYPAELIATHSTCHMVATEVPHDFGLAHGAKDDTSLLKFTFLVLFACHSWMGQLLTAPAHLGIASATRVSLLVGFLKKDFERTVLAVPQERVHLIKTFAREFASLCKDFRLVLKNCLKVYLAVLLSATRLHTVKIKRSF